MRTGQLILPQNPVFIVGNGRSGTTLLQSLLATQNGVYSFPETHFFSHVYPLLESDSGGFLAPD